MALLGLADWWSDDCRFARLGSIALSERKWPYVYGELKLEKLDGQKESERQLRARSYKAPRLHVYGAMTRLTAGGTGSAQEHSSGASKRP